MTFHSVTTSRDFLTSLREILGMLTYWSTTLTILMRKISMRWFTWTFMERLWQVVITIWICTLYQYCNAWKMFSNSRQVIEQYLENLKFSNREGHVVTVSSILGLFPSTNSVTYGCTKAATISYMNGLNEKIRREPTMCDRIKTTCICLPLADLKNLKPDESEVIETVSTITNAIIDEKSFVSQPSYLYKLTQGLTLLPLHIQQLARDLFLRETFWRIWMVHIFRVIRNVKIFFLNKKIRHNFLSF